MEGKFFIREFPVLSGSGAAKHVSAVIPLCRCHYHVLWPVLNTRFAIEEVASRTSEMPLSSFTVELLKIGEEEFHLGDRFALHSWCARE
jgi:hypothetical protein